ncbi:hypothetical protein BST97_01260 [Nonlabens spongiae]|uniref:Uncharacterized protein n=1 Tax=Nonlabens spongiae TaxID=331648 RepID=A0A1W6MGL6_9FLAO|nr:hypothetical protein [Nonlabens spongiae]ARN76741.1 hypothetical protein BST97_01260 [Nonlabens spongiae]
MDFLGVILIIVVIIVGFVVLPAWVSKMTGMSVGTKHGGTIARPDDFDKMKADSKNLAKKTKNQINNKGDLINKKIKGTYKYLFDKIEGTKLYPPDKTRSLSRFISLKKSIEERKQRIESDHEKSYLPESFKTNHPDFYAYQNEISEYNEYIEYIDKVDFKKYADFISQNSKYVPELAFTMIDKIGIKNANKVYGLIKEIEVGFWRNDLSEQESQKLKKVLSNKILG